MSATERDMEVLDELVRVCDAHLPDNQHGYVSSCRQTRRKDGATPLDCGGRNGSDHSYRLTKLVRLGYAEHRKGGLDWGKSSTRYRGSKVYRPTDAGREALAKWRAS